MHTFFTAFMFNILLNTLLCFLTVWIVVEFFLFILRVKSNRIKVLFRLLPLLKVAVDPFFYDFSSWCFLQGVDPLCCDAGTRSFTAAMQFEGWHLCFPVLLRLQLLTMEGMRFTFPDLLLTFLNPVFLTCGVVSFLLYTLLDRKSVV